MIKDVFLYVVLSVILIISFMFPLLNKSDNSGFKITYLGQEIFNFNYQTKEYSRFDFNGEIIVESNSNGVEITIFFDSDHLEYNILSVDYKDNSVKMKDSTCSHKKDCIYSPAIKDSGAIICAPHGIKVVCINGVVPPITG